MLALHMEMTFIKKAVVSVMMEICVLHLREYGIYRKTLMYTETRLLSLSRAGPTPGHRIFPSQAPTDFTCGGALAMRTVAVVRWILPAMVS